MKALNDKIKNYYSDLRLGAEFKAKDNLDRALKSPTVAKIYYDIKDTEFRLAKAEVFGSQEDVKKLNITLENLQNSLDSELKKIGLSSKEISVNYSCKTCGDTGFVGAKKCPDCYDKVVKKLQGESKFYLHDAPTFEGANAPEELLPYHKKLITFCDKFPNSPIKHLVFTGKTGSGKTYLAGCIVDRIQKAGFSSAFLTAFNLGELVIAYNKIFDKERLDFLADLIDTELLVIDDLGATTILLDKTSELLTAILNERDTQGKTTIITTNLTLDEIEEKYGERLFSRLFNKRITAVIEFKGKDLRITK